MTDNQQYARSIKAERDPTIFILALFFIQFRNRPWIKEDRRGAIKSDTMFSQILARLPGSHSNSY